MSTALSAARGRVMDEKIILTPDEAIELLPSGEHVHNFANHGTTLLAGCDFERGDAIAALRKAIQIELGGEHCMSMKHPIVAWDSKTHCSFFEADMTKVEALEATKR